MGITGNEVSAANQQRRNEELLRPPIGELLESGSAVGGAVAALGTSLVAGSSAGLAVAGSVVAGMGIVNWFRKLGTSKVNENLEALGQATEDALNRVEQILREKGRAIDEIKERLESNEFKDAMASASLQALRTTQKERLKRLALVLANGVKHNDLTPESTDDMMRAAIELNEADIALLGRIYEKQFRLLGYGYLSGEWSQQIAGSWAMHFSNLDNREHVSFRASLARLQSQGLIVAIETMMTRDGSIAHQPFGLLPEGKEFFERLQEIKPSEG
jgi:hypothetical protein